MFSSTEQMSVTVIRTDAFTGQTICAFGDDLEIEAWAIAPLDEGTKYRLPVRVVSRLDLRSGEFTETIYLFRSEDARTVFDLLRECKGMGAKSAFKALRKTPWMEIVDTADADLAKLPGLKTVAAELAKKLSANFERTTSKPAPKDKLSQDVRDAKAAVQALGVKPSVLNAAIESLTPEQLKLPCEDLIKILLNRGK